MKFQNSSADERLQQVEQAELELVEVVEEDGDALCRLLNRCVAWLRPAKFCRGDADTCSHLVAWNAWVCLKKYHWRNICLLVVFFERGDFVEIQASKENRLSNPSQLRVSCHMSGSALFCTMVSSFTWAVVFRWLFQLLNITAFVLFYCSFTRNISMFKQSWCIDIKSQLILQ